MPPLTLLKFGVPHLLHSLVAQVLPTVYNVKLPDYCE